MEGLVLHFLYIIGPWEIILLFIPFLMAGNYFFLKWKRKNAQIEIQKLEEKISIRTMEVMSQKYELEKKNEIIALKNKEMTDSLTYARRIQSAILPKPDQVFGALRDAFILYRPKDIVSGDFYFFSRKNDRTIVAVADCTGHGVAGAIMSMIGSSLIHQIVNERGITDPAEILNQLNEGVIDSLNQATNDTHDGMDVAICSMESDGRRLVYSGANRPLWLIRNNALEEFKPDKLPIGGMQIERKKPYSNREIQLRPDDAVYLFSDGYADQFGGLLGKKLMTKKFKEMMLSVHRKPMKEQEEFLSNFIRDWMGKDVEQTDDILVLGFRV